jgi:predicted PurR-regulated permease PerM
MNSTPQQNSDAVTRERFIAVALLALLGVAIYVVSSLLMGVVGGFILWGMSRGMFEWFERKTKGRRTLSAALSVVTLLVLVIAPVATILSLMVNDAVNLADQGFRFFQTLQPKIEEILNRFTGADNPTFLGYELNVSVLVEKLQEFSGTAAKYLVILLQKTAGGVASAVLQVFVMLYTVFFCYLDGAEFIDWLKKLLPLTSDESDSLLNKFFSTAITSLKALGALGAAQGILGGLAMWVCGIPSPVFWTILLIFATIIPVVGAQIILFPAAAFLIIMGDTGMGIGLFLWSWIVVANVDNLLRPYIVGRAVQLHELVVFLTTIGGIAVFGFWGFLIGPVIAALLKAVAEFYVETAKVE